MNECDENDQCDEIMALKSIYGHGFQCDVEKKPYEGRLNIEVDLHNSSSPLSVAYNFNADNLITLNHLSPLSLSFTLPFDYPSKNPPMYSLSCLWLTPEQLKLLSKDLDSLWEANCNGVILYSWLSMLQTETLNLLKIKFPLLLTEDKILKLTEYDLKRIEKEFRSSVHECAVCFTEKAGHLCIKFLECGHVFCKDCLHEFLNVQIRDGNVKSLQCLAEKCSSEINHSIVKNLVDPSTFERYDRLLLKITLESMADISYCPRPWCGCPVIVDKKCGMGSCQACQYTFCIFCKMVYHGIEKCRLKTEEMKKLCHSYREGTKAEQAELEKIYGKKMINEVVDQMETEQWLNSNSKQCPKCLAHIEKNDGCNKMACIKCKTLFCWLCLHELKGPNPYNHFADRRLSCYNKLFPFDAEENNNAEAENIAEEDYFLYGDSDGEFSDDD